MSESVVYSSNTYEYEFNELASDIIVKENMKQNLFKFNFFKTHTHTQTHREHKLVPILLF